jgi:hypothetical protein
MTGILSAGGRAAGRRRRGPLPRLLAVFLVWAGTLGAAAPAPKAESASKAAPPRPPSVRDSPGWYPNVDPESASVRIGRRTGAPVVSMPFQGGLRSLDDLGRTVCRLLAHNDRDSLVAICVADSEFREIMWREFPQSRPATGLQWDDAWRVLSMRLQGGCSDAVSESGGHYFQFLRFERTDTAAIYKNFKLHNGLVLVAKNERGEIERHGWLRSAVERKGRFKIYSVRD